MEPTVIVHMADYATCVAPQKITTIGLGSCVGVVLYDSSSGKCGMLHAMLPDSTRIRNNQNRMKFVDTGLEDLLKLMEREGVSRRKLVAKMAGGAKMFEFSGANETANIGLQNVEAAKRLLQKYGIPIIAEDTGKNYGRTIIFDPSTGKLEIKAVGHPISYI